MTEAGTLCTYPKMGDGYDYGSKGEADERVLIAAPAAARSRVYKFLHAAVGGGWAAFFQVPPGADTSVGDRRVFSVSLAGNTCYANRVRGKSPLPAFKAGDIVAWRIVEDAGRIEASFNGAPFVAVFSGLTAPIVAAGFDLCPGSSVRFLSDEDVAPGEWVGMWLSPRAHVRCACLRVRTRGNVCRVR